MVGKKKFPEGSGYAGGESHAGSKAPTLGGAYSCAQKKGHPKVPSIQTISAKVISSRAAFTLGFKPGLIGIE